MKPFGTGQTQFIRWLQSSSSQPIRLTNLIFRGAGKSSIAIRAIIWAAFYGHSLSTVYLAGNEELAAEGIASIQSEILNNDRLLDDFPEIVFPLRDINGKSNRCLSQTHNRRLTLSEWTNTAIVLPRIDGSAGSQCVIQSLGLSAATRGLQFTRSTGQVVRPQVVVVDDPQSDRTAASDSEIARRLGIIRNLYPDWAATERKTSIVVCATPIAHGDLIDQLTNKALNPGWSTIRSPMFLAMPDEEVLHQHWLGEYRELLLSYDDEDPSSKLWLQEQRRSTTSRIARKWIRGLSQVGARIPLESEEISAIQHGMNIYILEGADVFASECQLSPVRPRLQTLSGSPPTLHSEFRGTSDRRCRRVDAASFRGRCARCHFVLHHRSRLQRFHGLDR